MVALDAGPGAPAAGGAIPVAECVVGVFEGGFDGEEREELGRRSGGGGGEDDEEEDDNGGGGGEEEVHAAS